MAIAKLSSHWTDYMLENPMHERMTCQGQIVVIQILTSHDEISILYACWRFVYGKFCVYLTIFETSCR